MAYTKLYVHLVFTTKNRNPCLTPEIEERLYPYFSVICQELTCHLCIGNGLQDHVHLLILTPPSLTVAELTKRIKGASSRWLHETFPKLADFSWQPSYSAFSVGHSQLSMVYNYIARQKERHPDESHLFEPSLKDG